MTFVGEAVALDWVNGLTGDGAGVRDLDGSTMTLTSGADFVIGFYDYRYLTDVDDAVFALAFEATSGSASVQVSWGFDPTWNLEPSAATNPAGTHTLSTGITAVPLAGVSAAQYHAQTEELAVRVQVLSGSVTVDQARLRVWPPGGPVGAFGPIQTAPAIEFRPTIGVGVWSGTSAPFESSLSAAQEQARAAAAADPIGLGGASGWPTGSTVAVGNWGASVEFGASVIDPGTGPQASASVQAARFSIGFSTYEGEPTGVEGVDWVYPPDSTTPTLKVGERTIDWVQPIMTITAEPTQIRLSETLGDIGIWYPGPFTVGPRDPSGAKPTGPASTYSLTAPAGVQDAATPRPAFDIDVRELARPDGGVSFDILPNGLWETEPVLATLDDIELAGATVLRVMYGKATPSGASAIYTGEMDDVWTGWQELRYALTPAPFRVWNPAGVPIEPPLRQIQRDDAANGFSAGRWQPASSRQTSNRWVGYL